MDNASWTMEILCPRLKFKTYYTFLSCWIWALYFKCVHLQAQLCACCSTGILHKALGYFGWVQALSDSAAPQNSHQRAVDSSCHTGQSAVPALRQDGHRTETQPVSAVSPGTEREEMHDQIQPKILRRQLSHTCCESLYMCTWLEGSENSLENILTFSLELPEKSGIFTC